MVAHHTAGGCNLRPGDLLGSGTISGDAPDSRGCLLELTHAGRDEIVLQYDHSGESGGGSDSKEWGVAEVVMGAVRRRYLEDGDEVTLRGWSGGGDSKGDDEGGSGGCRIGFGMCRGKLLPCHMI